MTLAFKKPKELAAEMGISVRSLRQFARQLGVGHVLGKAMWFTAEDVREILEATKCRSPSTKGREAKSGTTVGRLPEVTFTDLQGLLTKRSLKESRTTPKRQSSKVVSIRERS